MFTNDVERNKAILAELDALIDKTKVKILDLAGYAVDGTEYNALKAFLEHVSDEQVLDSLYGYYKELADERTADLL